MKPPALCVWVGTIATGTIGAKARYSAAHQPRRPSASAGWVGYGLFLPTHSCLAILVNFIELLVRLIQALYQTFNQSEPPVLVIFEWPTGQSVAAIRRVTQRARRKRSNLHLLCPQPPEKLPALGVDVAFQSIVVDGAVGNDVDVVGDR